MNYALIFAGGVGSRMNSKARPKQFLEIHGKPILIHTIEHFELHPDIDSVCLVIVKEWIDYAKKLIEKFNLKKVKWVVPGGSSALESQFLGLQAMKTDETITDEDIVLIHDGVRPLINEQVITDCIEGVKQYGSAVTVAPAIETIIRADESGIIKDTFPRAECKLARAPQSFLFNEIMVAHQKAKEEGKYDYIDSTSLLLHFNKKIHTVIGPSENIKVTNPADFYICRALLDAKENSQIYGF